MHIRIATANRELQSGFALVATLSLMILLTIVAVGLLSLSSVALRSGQQSAAMTEARANARLAMMLAIGELQKSMGPDQAVSAPASIFDAKPETPEIDGVANPLWVAAMPAVDPNGSGTLATAAENNRKHAIGLDSTERVNGGKPTSRQMRWLASMPPSATADPGQALDSSVEAILGADEVVKILEARSEIGGTTKTLEVEVGKVAVSNASGKRTGSYAWWVGDEGIKAKFTNADPDPTLASTPLGTPVNPLLWQKTQGRGLYLDHVAAQPPHSVLATGGDLQKLVSNGSIDLLSETWRQWHGSNSADFTVHGYGLPVDVADGGLKQDLTVYLETGKGLPDDSDILRGGKGDTGYAGPGFPVDFSEPDKNNLPKFGLLKGWHDLGKDFAAGSVESRPQTLEQHGLHPHVKRSGVLMSMAVKQAPRPILDNPATPGNEADPNHYEAEFVLVLFPFIELWNPYTVALPAEKYLAEVTAPSRVILHSQKNFVQAGTNKAPGLATPHPGQPSGTIVDFDLLGDGLVKPVNAGDYPFGGNRPWLRMVVDTGDLGNGPAGLMPGESVLVSPILGSIPTRGYDASLDYQDYNSGTSANLAEHKRIDANAFSTPDGCYIFHNFAKTAKLPKPEPNTRRFYWVRYKNPSLNDGTSTPRWNGVDNTPLFRLSRLDAGGPQLLTYRDPTRSDKDRQNETLNGWDWAGGGEQPVGLKDQPGATPANSFPGLPRLDLGNFNGNVLRNADTIFMDTLAIGPNYVQGGYRVLATANPRAGILRPGPQLPATWQDQYAFYRPAHRYEPYESSAFSGNWRLASKVGPWGRYGAIEGFTSMASNQGNSNLQTGTTYAYFDFPRRYGPIHSLGQLLHANLNPLPWGSAYQAGYSRAPRLFARDKLTGDPGSWQLKNENIDLPYLVNASLWDRFFLSTIPQSGTLDRTDKRPPLPNPRHRLLSSPAAPLATATLQDSATAFQRNAASVAIDGCFNVNSTSVAAWEAMLLAHSGLKIEVAALNRTDNGWKTDYNPSGDKDQVFFPRVPDPVFGVKDNAAFDSALPRTSYFARAGNHVTNRAEVRKLAESIVAEVKRRGPFLSMADFVNRRLVADSNKLDVDYLGLMGTLDAAILRASQEPGVLNHQLIFGESPADNPYGTRLDPTEKLASEGHSADEREPRYAVPTGHVESALEGVSAYLMQGDLLTHLGANMSARSDTFTIRTYGEARDSSGKVVLASARAEAIVQRVIDPLDPADDVTKPAGPMGRSFVVVAFRWLTNQEIQ